MTEKVNTGFESLVDYTDASDDATTNTLLSAEADCEDCDCYDCVYQCDYCSDPE